MSSGSAEPQLHPPMGCPWAKATWGAVVGTGRPGGGEAPPHPSYPLELRTTSLLLGGEDPGKWICPGGERHPPPLPRPWRCAQDVQVVCSEGGGGIPGVTNTRNSCTDPETPPGCPLPQEAIGA